ncbi:MAG: hypothetical protein IPI83_08000 [Sphingomonadales bacterium]|nr:hypothetical protein [Sphingomonadales bacterium]
MTWPLKGSWAQILMPDGQTAYATPGWRFSMSAEGTIVTGNGLPLQPQIQVPEGATSVSIGADGTVTAQRGQTGLTELGKIGAARFVESSFLAGTWKQSSGSNG